MNMNRFFVLLFFSMFGLFDCINSNHKGPTVIFENLNAKNFANKIAALDKSKYQILDVRTKDEYDSIHLIDAMNIDFYAADFKTKIGLLDKSKAYFVYCRSGSRSGKTVNLMKELGFNEVYNLTGGIYTNTELLPIAK